LREVVKMKNLALRAFETGNGNYRHVNFRFVTVDHEDEVRNIISSYQDKHFEFFDDLVIHCQIGGVCSEGEEMKPYSWGADYQDLYSVGLDGAEKMVKTLRRLEKGLDRIQDKLGYAETYADYVLRVANVLGVKVFVFQRTFNGDQYSANEYDFEYQFASAKHRINMLIDKNIESLKGNI
jgi:hypothetical protein